MIVDYYIAGMMGVLAMFQYEEYFDEKIGQIILDKQSRRTENKN